VDSRGNPVIKVKVSTTAHTLGQFEALHQIVDTCIRKQCVPMIIWEGLTRHLWGVTLPALIHVNAAPGRVEGARRSLSCACVVRGCGPS
jgi:hypothetical protein